MAIRAALLAFLLAILGGCAGSLPDLTQAHGPCSNEPGGWCPFTRELAAESWEYAQLSSNAYCDETTVFKGLAGRTEVARGPSLDICQLERRAALGDEPADATLKTRKTERGGKNGFAYAVYDLAAEGDGPAKRVIAYRGTDITQIADWLHGNLGRAQRDLGLALYREQRAQLDSAGKQNVPIVVTGHSMGGAIALEVSQAFEGVSAYVFNTSPQYKLAETVNANRRVAISERGDFLGTLRRRRRPVRQDMLTVNCSPSAQAIGNHSIRSLAECLTWIAARGNARAKASLEANAITEPPEGEGANLLWGLPVKVSP